MGVTLGFCVGFGVGFAVGSGVGCGVGIVGGFVGFAVGFAENWRLAVFGGQLSQRNAFAPAVCTMPMSSHAVGWSMEHVSRQSPVPQSILRPALQESTVSHMTCTSVDSLP